MPVTGRTRTAIRTALLTDWAARVTAAGMTLDVSSTGWAYRLADSLSADLLREEGNAEALAAEVFPETATEATIARHAELVDLPRDVGSKGRYTVTLTSLASGWSGTVSLWERTLTRSGKVYLPVDAEAVLTGGTGTTVVEAAEAGTDYELEAGDTLTWDAAPVYLKTTAAVTGPAAAEPSDEEGLASWAGRVRDYRRARPASGSPAHLVELLERHEDVHQAYCYPCLAPGGYADTLLDTPGCWNVVVLGPPQGTGTTNTRQLSVPARARVAAYLLGVQDASGNATPGGSPLFYAGLLGSFSASDVSLDDATWGAAVNVSIDLYPDAEHDNPGTPTTAVVGAGTTASSVVVAGDCSSWEGYDATFYVTTTVARGGYQKRTVVSAVYSAGPGTTALTLDEPLDAVPGIGSSAGTAPSNWTAVRDAVFALFDAQGPGDVPRLPTYNEIWTVLGGGALPSGVVPTTHQAAMLTWGLAQTVENTWQVYWATDVARRRRWPPEIWRGLSGISREALEEAAMVDGMQTVVVGAPGASVVALPKEMRTLGTLVLALV